MSKSRLTDLILEANAKEILRHNLEYVHWEGFVCAAPEEIVSWLGPMPGMEEYVKEKDGMKPHPGMRPESAARYRWPVLNRDQEKHLFRKFNFLKYMAIQGRLQLRDGKFDVLADVMNLQGWASETREFIICANTRLVLLVANSYCHFINGRKDDDDFWQIVSWGDQALLRSVELFDFTKNIKFSTYATTAIKNIASRFRVISDPRRSPPMTTGNEIEMENAPAPNGDFVQDEDATTYKKDVVQNLISYLEPRERRVVNMLAGINGPASTLREVAKFLGITYERIRQINDGAKKKLLSISKNMGIRNTI